MGHLRETHHEGGARPGLRPAPRCDRRLVRQGGRPARARRSRTAARRRDSRSRDVLLAALAVVVAVRVWRADAPIRGSALALTVAAAVFAALIVLTALANGGTAFVAAGEARHARRAARRAARPVDSTDRLWVVVAPHRARSPPSRSCGRSSALRSTRGSRQAAFLGEHDLAALSTACLVVWLAALHAGYRLIRLPARRRGRRVRSGSSSALRSRACSGCTSPLLR